MHFYKYGKNESDVVAGLEFILKSRIKRRSVISGLISIKYMQI